VGPSSGYYIALDKVVVIAGPTASGKSAYALKFAQDNKGTILNGDSLQVYRGLEILTAQPSFEDQQQIPHHLYGFLDPHETCSAWKWRSLLIPDIEKAHKEGLIPVVVGGTGLYLKALLEGLSPVPSVEPSIRKDLESQDQAQLYAKLGEVDADSAHRIKPQDRQRTLRALEVFYGTGKPLSLWLKKKPTPLPYHFEKILLMPSKEELEIRIKHRLDEMFQNPRLLEEVKTILACSPSPNALKAIGLREIDSFLKGECSLDEAKSMTLIHTLQYAKRQRTWFRHQFKADVFIDRSSN